MLEHHIAPRNTIAPRSFVHSAALFLVWATFALSGLVFSEPCPTDALALALMILLPVIGFVRMTPLLSLFLLLWAVVAAMGLVSANFAEDTGKAVSHVLVTFFLAGGAFTVAAFVGRRPLENMRLIFSGSMVAAVVATACGLAGYFDLFPGADIFTKFGRAAGTFKDPNVFGPFLVPSILYALHTALQRSLKRAPAPLALAGFLSLGVLLSFSRGAWINLGVSLALYLGLAFLTAETQGRRLKIALLAFVGAATLAGGVAGVLQNDKVAGLMSERASVTQNYDIGPDGRFGGQEKAIDLILANPLGIGAAQFAPYYHHEEAHNVYLSVTMAAGWLGSGFYIAAVLLTLRIGFAEALRRTPWQPLILIAVSAFAANVAEGLIIDTDHWRHFYLLMAFIWGAAAAREQAGAYGRARRRPSRLVAA